MQPASKPEANNAVSDRASFITGNSVCVSSHWSRSGTSEPSDSITRFGGRRFRQRHGNRLLTGARQFFHQVENSRNEEDPEGAGGHHPPNHRGSHDLASH